ncbi:hypothetical protein OG607_44930 [Streptomyces sp. NBC_01537]|uniref:DinB/UmuC family translesion DNA polymerase n=1 Tax=Streptomyces sp. NBC_01537 TaxID=2903896 RepID=UPI0038677133
MIPTGLPSHITEQRLLDHDTLDPDHLRTELLNAAVAAGDRLRRRHQVAHSLTLGIAFADGSRIERTRTLREPTAHTADLRTLAFAVFDSFGLQRARVRGFTLRTPHRRRRRPAADHARSRPRERRPQYSSTRPFSRLAL